MEIIQSMWVGPKLSAMEQMCIKSYLKYGHQFHLYVYQDTEDVPAGTTVLDANTIVPASRIFTYDGAGFGRKSYAGFADLFRYTLLRDKGNWWVDTDSICIKPFDFNQEYVFSTESPVSGMGLLSNINCGNLKAPRNSEIYQWLCNQCSIINPKMQWGAIGPKLMKAAVAKFNLERFVKAPEVFCPVPFDFECATLLDKRYQWNFTNETYAIHLWNEGWRAKELDKEGQYDPDCLYERLKKQYDIVGTGSRVVFQSVIKPRPMPVTKPQPVVIRNPQRIVARHNIVRHPRVIDRRRPR